MQYNTAIKIETFEDADGWHAAARLWYYNQSNDPLSNRNVEVAKSLLIASTFEEYLTEEEAIAAVVG